LVANRSGNLRRKFVDRGAEAAQGPPRESGRQRQAVSEAPLGDGADAIRCHFEDCSLVMPRSARVGDAVVTFDRVIPRFVKVRSGFARSFRLFSVGQGSQRVTSEAKTLAD
jgi:hypothetical protein